MSLGLFRSLVRYLEARYDFASHYALGIALSGQIEVILLFPQDEGNWSSKENARPMEPLSVTG